MLALETKYFYCYYLDGVTYVYWKGSTLFNKVFLIKKLACSWNKVFIVLLLKWCNLRVCSTGIVANHEGDLGDADLEAGHLVDVEVGVGPLGNLLLLSGHSKKLGLIDFN